MATGHAFNSQNPGGGFISSGGAHMIKAPKKRRAGLMKAVIGANFMIRCSDGRNRQFQVRDYRLHANAAVQAICLFCKRKWETAEAMLQEHPEHMVMEKQDEPHVYALWSDDPIEKQEVSQDPKAPKAKVDPGKVIGLLSDEHPPST